MTKFDYFEKNRRSAQNLLFEIGAKTTNEKNKSNAMLPDLLKTP